MSKGFSWDICVTPITRYYLALIYNLLRQFSTTALHYTALHRPSLQCIAALHPESQKPLQLGSIAARKFCQFSLFCGNFQQNSCCFIAKFPLTYALFCGGEKKMLFCRKLFKNIEVALLENVHKKCLVEKFPKQIALLENFHNKINLFFNFHKNSLCWNISTKNYFVYKFPQKIALWENFHKHLLC